ncbi:MAG: hypothetical protein KC503_36300 [Myxococcales bacterium]|nr:hypothetical protein [Myxococcales bacterium]
MSDDDRPELHLNTLARFSKRNAPSALALEEHGHCEVPAGCGGVVMRWRDPRVGLDVLIEIAASNTVQTRVVLDGVPMQTARAAIPFGEHVLDIEIVREHDEPTLLWIAAIVDLAADRALGAPRVLRQLCSAGDGAFVGVVRRWPGTRADVMAAFSDGEFDPLEAAPDLEPPDELAWRINTLRQRGAIPLRLPPAQAFQVRRRFVLDAAADGLDAAPLADEEPAP